MIQENEVVTFVISLGAVILMLFRWQDLRKVPASPLMLASFSAFVLGWVFTILEGLFWPQALNLAEHTAYTIGVILLAIWVWRLSTWEEQPGSDSGLD